MAAMSASIRTRLFFSFAAILLLLLGAAVAGYFGVRSVGDFSIGLLHGDVTTATLAGDLRAKVLELRRYEKDVLINVTAPESVTSYYSKWQAASLSAQQQTERLAAQDQQLAVEATELSQHLAAYGRGFDETHRLIAARSLATTQAANEHTASYKDSIRTAEELAANIQRRAVQRASEAEAAVSAKVRAVDFTLLGLSAAGLAGALMLAIWLVRAITQPLDLAAAIAGEVAAGRLGAARSTVRKDEFGRVLNALAEMDGKLLAIVGDVRTAAEHVNLGAREISQGNDDLSQRTQEQASALQQTAASIEQITASVQQNAANAGQAGQLARAACGVAEKGGEDVQHLASAMQTIATSSEHIERVVSVIDEIAFQTNLLALNASVEAARAGEQGRGFAVVASEVRNLAQRSAAAAREIKTVIAESAERVRSGSHLAEAAGQSLGDIVSSVRKLATVVENIAAASAEQAAGVEQINQAIAQLDGMTQQNSAAVEQIAAASKSLLEHASRLSERASHFTLRGQKRAEPTHVLDAMPIPRALTGEPERLVA